MSDVRADIERSNAAFSAAIAAQDLIAIAEAYAEDATLLLDGVPEQVGRDAIRAFFGHAFAAGLRSLEFATRSVQAFGEIAVERGTYTMVSAGADQPQSGRYVVVHRKGEDGLWRALYDVTQQNPR